MLYLSMALKPVDINYDTWVSSRILSRSVQQTNGCIEYQGNAGHKYGLISITAGSKRQLVPAHRAMYMAINEQWELPRNLFIRHKCDNPRCVNIEHLEPGTPRDNIQDMLKRGRGAKTHKKHTRLLVFTDEQIRAIRNATGKYKWIAEEHGVSIGYVSKIKAGKAKTLI